MKAGWEARPLESLATFRSGLWTGKKGPFTTAKVIRNTNIRAHGQLSLEDVAEIEVETKQLETRRLRPGDIILERSGGGPKQAVGRAVYFDLDEDDFSFSNFTSIIRVQSPALSYRFLHMVLNWWYETGVTEKIQSNSTGIRNLDFTAYKALPIPLPPLEEQHRIVAVLDEAFEGLARARAHAEANLQNARELFAGTIACEFSKVADAPMRRVGEVAQHSLGKMLDKLKNKGTPRGYLRNINVRWFEVDTSDILEMRVEAHEVERYSVRPGDLLICEGGYPGRCAVWQHDSEMYFQKALHRVRFSDEVYGRLLMYFLFMEDQSGSLCNHFSGAGIQHFTGQALAKYLMPFPTISDAEGMVAKIEAMHVSSGEVEQHYLTKLQSFDALRQSLLQKAFAGELT